MNPYGSPYVQSAPQMVNPYGVKYVQSTAPMQNPDGQPTPPISNPYGQRRVPGVRAEVADAASSAPRKYHPMFPEPLGDPHKPHPPHNGIGALRPEHFDYSHAVSPPPHLLAEWQHQQHMKEHRAQLRRDSVAEEARSPAYMRYTPSVTLLNQNGGHNPEDAQGVDAICYDGDVDEGLVIVVRTNDPKLRNPEVSTVMVDNHLDFRWSMSAEPTLYGNVSIPALLWRKRSSDPAIVYAWYRCLFITDREYWKMQRNRGYPLVTMRLN